MNKPPIASPLNWIVKTTTDDYADSIVAGLTGPKRGGKTLTMVKVAFMHLCAGRKVWSNIPIQTPKYFLELGWPMLKTMPLDWDAFFMMDGEFQDGLIVLDEASSLNSNRQWGSMKNRVMNAFTNQIGHRKLDVVWTAKSANWLDRQGLGFETDVEIKCYDIAKTRWGRINHIKKGMKIACEAWDLSGALTGRISNYRDKNARAFFKWTAGDMDHYWGGYDTRALQTVEELFTGVKMDLKKRVISNKTDDDVIIQKVRDMAIQCLAEGDTIPCDDFRNEIRRSGLEISNNKIGTALKNIGVRPLQKRGGSIYDLSGLDGGDSDGFE